MDITGLPEASLQAEWDVVIVGAGAAGMMAAYQCASRGLKTLLLEKNRKVGVKILISGGTRCNLTHDCEHRGIMAAFGSAGKFLHSALAAFSPEALLEFFHSRGLPTYVEEGTGKIFPLSNRAADVVEVLRRAIDQAGVTLHADEPVQRINKEHGQFTVHTAQHEYTCRKVVLATGGVSYPRCGTTGDGYAWAMALGHTIRAPRPALVPLTTHETWVLELSGITLEASVSVVDLELEAQPHSAKSKRQGLKPGVLIERRGALLFTHFGLSGPAAMDVSRAVTSRNVEQIELRVDFLPDVTERDLEDQLRSAAHSEGKKACLSFMLSYLQRRLAEALLHQAKVSAEKKLAELSKLDITRVIKVLKHAAISLSGTRGFDKAEVTAGGVPLDEVDSRTMESKLCPGLYLVGEILDLDGYIGGFNFQAAFATGYLAGSSI